MKLATTTGDFDNYCEHYLDRVKCVCEAGFRYIDLCLYDADGNDELIVSCRGMLYDQLFHSRDEQKSMLEKDGLTVVPCGAYGRSLKVDNYKSLLFADFR